VGSRTAQTRECLNPTQSMKAVWNDPEIYIQERRIEAVIKAIVSTKNKRMTFFIPHILPVKRQPYPRNLTRINYKMAAHRVAGS